MSTAPIYEMKTSQGTKVPLIRTAISGLLRDTALETTVTQHYRNSEADTIEGIYTFPLPVGATLMNLEVELNGEVLLGTVVAAPEAQDIYEDAITDGDSALLLQQISDALFTLNVGNLQPEDTAIVSIKYVQLLSWQQNTLRIMYPTTIGDRYGRPSTLGMQPHQVTSEDLAVEHRAEFSLKVDGQLACCAVTCPSHSLAIRAEKDELYISSAAAGLTMDRDIVLSITRPDTLASCAGYYDRDLRGKWVGWLSVNPEVAEVLEPRNITIVVDCSGSMGGISIQQAKIAVREIVEQLGDKDCFNIILFGSFVQSLFPEPVPCSRQNKADALQLIMKIEADMGGTEIGAALDTAYGNRQLKPRGDLLLITDGQSYDIENTIRNASSSGIRHFTVGVGTAVAEDMITGLAAETGGAFELVSPSENMAQAIVRHVKRSYAPPLSDSETVWPVKPCDAIPEVVSHAFSGDTLHLFARFDEKPEGQVAIRLRFGDQDWQRVIPLAPYSTSSEECAVQGLQLARLCAAKRLKTASEEEQQSIGLEYQLQTVNTSYVLAAERETKDESVTGPALRIVPQMRKANGRSEVLYLSAADDGTQKTSLDWLFSPRGKLQGPTTNVYQSSFEIPGHMKGSPGEARRYGARPSLLDGADTTDIPESPERFASGINQHFQAASLFRRGTFPTRLAELKSMGLDTTLLQTLLEVFAERHHGSEAQFVTTLLALFLRHPAATALNRGSVRAIVKAHKRLAADPAITEAVLKAFEDDRVHTSWRL